MLIFLYNLFSYVVFLPLLKLTALFHVKLKQNVEGRRGLHQRVLNYVRQIEQEGRIGAVILFHVSSAGEFEQARPLISLLKKQDPALRIVISFFSNSGIKYIASKNYDEADFVDFSPFDFYFDMKRYLQILRPTAIVFVRYDLWPNFIYQAVKNKIPLYLIDASVHLQSWRTKVFIRGFYARLFNAFDRIMASSELDGREIIDNFSIKEMDRVIITGDTKYDRVLEIHENMDSNISQRYRFAKDVTYLVAGSTWEKDEAYLIAAYQAQKEKGLPGGSPIQFIIVPHELERVPAMKKKLTECQVDFIELSCFSADVPVRFSGMILVNQLGVLSDLYRIAQIAYVGGALHYRVHNVLEPAVMGIPILFGPLYKNSGEAVGLLEYQAARTFLTVEELIKLLDMLIYDNSFSTQMGASAYQFIKRNSGASKKCLAAIADCGLSLRGKDAKF